MITSGAPNVTVP